MARKQLEQLPEDEHRLLEEMAKNVASMASAPRARVQPSSPVAAIPLVPPPAAAPQPWHGANRALPMPPPTQLAPVGTRPLAMPPPPPQIAPPPPPPQQGGLLPLPATMPNWARPQPPQQLPRTMPNWGPPILAAGAPPQGLPGPHGLGASMPAHWGLPHALPMPPPPPPPTVLPQHDKLLTLKEEALKKITSELREQQAVLALIKQETNPELLRQQVEMQKRITEAVKERDLGRARERGKQDPAGTLGGAALDIGRSLPGVIGRIGGHGQAIAAAATGEKAAGISGALSGMGVGALAGPMGAIAAAAPAAIGALKDVAGSIVDTTKAIVQTIVSWGSAASIGAMVRWDLATREASAAIGRLFVPAMDALTRGVRVAGDVFISVAPSMAQMREAFAPIEAVIEKIRPELMKLGPALKDILVLGVQVWAQLASAFWDFHLKALKIVVALNEFRVDTFERFRQSKIGQGLDRAGLLMQQQQFTPGSVHGAAPYHAKFEGVEEFLKTQYASALTQSDKMDPAKQTADNTARMVELLQQIARGGGPVPVPVPNDVDEAVQRAMRGW